MQIIMLSDRLGPARSYSFSLRHALLVAALLVAALVWSGFLGFRFANDGTPAMSITLGRMQQSPQIDQLALRVGELQARMARLNAIGERVAKKAGVPLPGEGELQPGRGGPLVDSEQRKLTAAEVAGLLDSLGRELEQATDQLMVLEAEMLLRQTSQGKLAMDRPVAPSAYLSSVFGLRTDPFTGRRARHEGLDFADQLGAPILAAESGVVLRVENRPQYGYSVDVDHGNGLVTRYGHIHKALVKQGDIVKRGQEIAQVGSSGRSTGPHLHFEVLKNGVPQNPMAYIAAASS